MLSFNIVIYFLHLDGHRVTVVESLAVYWANRYSNIVTGAGGIYNCPETFEFPLERDQSYANVDLDEALGVGAPPYDIIAGPVISNPTRLDFSAALREGVTVTLRMTGAMDTSSDCSFQLILIDNQAPNIICPGNRELHTSSSDIEVFWPPAVARDNVGLRSINPITYSHINGVRLPVSPDPVIITATAYDTSDNAATCDFRILVGEQGDNDNLIMIDCPVDEIVTFPLDVGTSHSTIDLDIQGRDASGQTVPVYRTEGPTDVILPGVVEYSERFRDGQRFTFVAEDPVTRMSSTCSFVVKLVDDESPTIKCPDNVEVRTTQDMTSVTWPPATAIDNLAAPSNITISYRPENGANLEATDPPKISVITAEARDLFDNAAQCQFIVALQKVAADCSSFPSLPDASATCLTTSSGQAQCYVSCDLGFRYVMTSNLFVCEIGTNGDAYWNPSPNEAMCAEPQYGERLSKSVTIRFIVPDVVCLKDDDELAMIVRNFIVPQLITESLCEYRTARACQDQYIVPYCGGKPGIKKRRRRRQSGETLLDVDIEVSSEVNNNTNVLQVINLQQDVNTLVLMIEDYVMENQLMIQIDDEEHLSRTDWSIMSSSFAWKCPQGWKVTDVGCVPCPQGSYQDTDGNICEFCPRNTYQEQPQQTSCLECTGENTIEREGTFFASGCYSVTSSSGGQGTSFAGLTAIFVIFCIILCLALLFIIVVGIIYCCMRNKITHRFASSTRKRSTSKLHYLNEAFESDNDTMPGPDMRYENNSGTARRNVSRQFSRSSLSTQYGYSQSDPDDLALMNSNFSFGARDEDGGLVMRPVDGSGRSEHGSPDGGESTSSPGPPEEGGGGTSQPPTNQGERRDEKVLDESTGEYLWPAPPSPPSPPPPPAQREGETVLDDNGPTTRL
ncbi:uncharacterized protein LOC105445494 [Strongylocentrotus purpuratus]|uniref:HYR domain-containing protein n=1 Tax=Strongylocentrotus purpuratus TaxID=7668 RepID=A0A7M7NA95_STRPU|nr:uncharacterized protein LOC105445494 [Strongylocentrotus purpuratus]